MLRSMSLICALLPLRAITLALTVFTSVAYAGTPVVLQRPISLETATGELFGTLLLPKSATPVPVVLIIAGSGPTDRDGNNFDGGRNDSLKRLAVILAKHNIASVRYDKRGVAASKPATPDERDLSIEKYVADAAGWGQKLKADPRLGKLIVLGHSEGALVASTSSMSAPVFGHRGKLYGAATIVWTRDAADPADFEDRLRSTANRISAAMGETSHEPLPHPVRRGLFNPPHRADASRPRE